MLRQRSVAILPAIAFVFVLVFSGQSAQADWNVSLYGEVGGPSYTSYGDRITSEYRRGYQVDDWTERGSSSVTESPTYSDGIRLASWATQYEDDYDYGIASAIYFFEVPRNARSIRIKIAYEGEADRGYLDDDLVGRVWIRRSQPGDDYEEYYPKEGRYEDVDEPLYGDTFALRARKRLEIIRISAEDHTIDDMMELHVVAEGRQSVDVKYIEIETYSYLPSVRVITRYYKDYVWRPWHNYTYWYYYTGPVFHFSDYYYVRYTYPRYRYHYVDIRKRYNNYLNVYYVKRPRERVRWANVVRVPKGTRRTWNRGHLNRWTSSHEETRRMYSVVKTGKTRSSVDVRKSRTRIRSVLSSHTRSSPAAVRSRGTSSSVQQRTSVRTPSSRSTEVKSRQVERSSTTPRSRPEVRTGTDRQRKAVSSPTRVETRGSTKTRDTEVRSPARTRSSSSSQSDRTKSVRQAPTRSSNNQQRETRSNVRSKTRVESSKPKEEERKRSSSVIRTPSKSQSTKKSPPKKKVEVKKDDDDDDEDKKKSSSTKTSTKSKSSSTKKRKVRSR